MFDEEEAIQYIKAHLLKSDVSEDDIYFILDCIWDYYDDYGMLDISFDADDDEPDMEELHEYVRKAIRKDGEIEIEDEIMREIILKELEYEKSVEEDF